MALVSDAAALGKIPTGPSLSKTSVVGQHMSKTGVLLLGPVSLRHGPSRSWRIPLRKFVTCWSNVLSWVDPNVKRPPVEIKRLGANSLARGGLSWVKALSDDLAP
ncbi:hypothetical protein QYF36_021022 [Acer negundo]|nr:hypothetical protein QYF36_021022 [Acer negundo]